MDQPRCIITDKPITSANNSRAHVIPSALGGRLKPWDILSKDGNSLLGDKVDLPLIQAFQAVMTLLNASRDRGENQPVQMKDASGRTLVLRFGEPLGLARPEYEESESAEGIVFDIKARTLKELSTLLGRVKAKYPDFDIDEAIQHAVAVHSWPDGMLHGQLQIGSRVVFPSLFVSASIFAVYHKQAPHPALRDYVARFDPDNPEMPPDTFYFIPPRSWISAPGDVTHIVALWASAERKAMLIYFELLNAVPVAVLLPYGGTEDVRATYAVDILSGTEVPATIDESSIQRIAWQATHQLGDADLLQYTRERISRLLGLAQQRAWQANLKALWTRAFGTDEDGPLKPQDIVNATTEITDFVLEHWRHPLTTMYLMQHELQQFDGLCSGLEKFVASRGLGAFRVFVQTQRQRLTSVIDAKRVEAGQQ
jgi:hypothetical protein